MAAQKEEEVVVVIVITIMIREVRVVNSTTNSMEVRLFVARASVLFIQGKFRHRSNSVQAHPHQYYLHTAYISLPVCMFVCMCIYWHVLPCVQICVWVSLYKS